MFELQLQPVAAHFQGLIIGTPIFQGTFLDWFPRWNANRFLLAQSHSCISFIIYIRVPNPDATEVSIQWPDLSLNNRSPHRSIPTLSEHRRAGKWLLQNTVWSQFHLQFLFCIYACVFVSTLYLYIHIYIYMHVYIYIFPCIYKTSKRYKDIHWNVNS